MPKRKEQMRLFDDWIEFINMRDDKDAGYIVHKLIQFWQTGRVDIPEKSENPELDSMLILMLMTSEERGRKLKRDTEK